MTSEERESLITAYALNDPGLSSADREEIESLVAHDAEVRQAVEETRQLGRLLSEGLAAEQAKMPSTAVTIPASVKSKDKNLARVMQFLAASIVVLAVAGTAIAVRANRKAEADRAAEMKQVARTGANDEPGTEFLNKSLLAGDPSEKPAGYTAPNDPYTNKDGGQKVVSETEKLTTTKVQMITPALQLPPSASGPAGPGLPASPAVPGMGGRSGATVLDEHSRIRGPGRPGGAPLPVVASPAPGLVPPGSPGPAVNVEAPPTIDPALPPSPLPRDSNKGEPQSNDRFHQLIENAFIKVEGQNALSTFGVDVDTASYSIVRKFLSMGQMPPPNAVRLEEMVNYFPYADKAPTGDDPFAVTVEMAECPWEPAHRLVRLGLKAKPIANEKRPLSNLVFLIDVSGSMNEPNKLPLVKASLKLLVNQLGENDRVAMVVYAGASGLVLDSTSAMKKDKILDALDNLQAGGSTNGEGGMHQAYEVAKANFIKGGTNRVILCTDGDWNVGTTSTEALIKMVEQKRETGVFLSVFGFGMGNLRDEMMVNLAGKGNGNYGYIDSLKEANKAFVEQIGGTLVTVAKDVKVQIEFNPAAVKSYRLLGYEKRILAAKDFHDDKKDAGEMGAGHVVTALYELVPAGAADPVVGKVDGLRYQKEHPKPAVKIEKADEAFVVKMRHKMPDAKESTLRELPVSNVTKQFEKTSEDFQFAAAVASFAMLLRDSPYKGSSNYGLVLELAASAKKREPGAHGEYRTEFIELVKKAKTLSGKP